MGGSLTQRQVKRSGGVLLVAFTLTIGSFVGAGVTAQLGARGIQEAAHRMATQLAPSVTHLATLSAALRHLEVELTKASDHLRAGTVTPDRERLATARTTLVAEWKTYPFDTTVPDEARLWPVISKRLEEVAATAARIAELIESGDATGASRALAGDLAPVVDRVDLAIAALRLSKVGNQAELAGRIASLRRRSFLLTLWLGGASILIGVAAAVVAFCMVRRTTTLLARRADELETFAGRVAHDVRTPLSVVSLSLDMLARRARGDDLVKATVLRGKRAVARCAETLDALLGFARAATGPTPGAVADVEQVVTDVLDSARPAAEERRIRLAAANLEPCRVACAPGLLWTLMANLVGNAVKYMGNAPLRQVVVRVSRVDDRVHIDVEDTGPGIPHDLMERLFDPYVRAVDSTEPGIGLGLATVRRVVEAHGGRVGVDSGPGRGARFWLELPGASAMAS